ncbi:hypothetical protein ACH4TC_18575 [Streptomyces spororaveus]|uniref:hypothetical protein n=1 Tax=Streptomyces spororaveus TaxID=284039 RepID=UPI0037A42D8E
MFAETMKSGRWAALCDFPAWGDLAPSWHAELVGDDLLVQHDGITYDGTFPANREWRTAARESGFIVAMTADIIHPVQMGVAAEQGSAYALTIAYREGPDLGPTRATWLTAATAR